MLPKDYPPKSTVFDYFSAWRKSGLWVELNTRLRVKVRVADGRKPSPTAAILDRQSVKGAEQGGEAIGYDAGKKIGGRKRHILVDTLGMLLTRIFHGFRAAAFQRRSRAAQPFRWAGEAVFERSSDTAPDPRCFSGAGDSTR